MIRKAITWSRYLDLGQRSSILRLLGLCILALAVSGCGPFRESVVIEQGANLSTLRSFYVIEFPAEKRNMHNVIKDQLLKSGRRAMAGKEDAVPPDIDALVSYRSIWHWDLSYYLLELHITIRDPKTKFPMATGLVVRPGLARTSSDAMAAEVLNNIFKGKSYDRR